MPHAYLKTINPEVELMQIVGTSLEELKSIGDQLKEFNIAVLCREVNSNGSGAMVIEYLQSLGIKVVLDVDDYWILPSSHKLKRAYEHFNIPQLIIDNIKVADYVTTPNKLLAKYIAEHNAKVMYLPNVPDKLQSQFKIEDNWSNVMRFGWVGGVYHREDIEPLERSFEKLWREKGLANKWQLCLGGFNVNREYLEIERTFTNDYKFIDIDYKEYLHSCTPLIQHASNNKPYKRLWAKSADQYVSMYNEIDVALIPLKDNNFNTCKSALKVVEAAAMGKGVIVSDTYPYKEICNNTNSILIGHSKPHKEWFEAIKLCCLEPNMVSDLAKQLTIDCEREFNIDKITKERKDLYTWLTK